MRRLAALLFLCTLATCHSPLATAQEGSATLTGVIQDASKAVIPGAKVTVIKTDTNTQFTATTGKDGNYTLASLPVGPYQVQIEKPGFKTILKDDLFLHTQDALELNFEMAVGSASESVTVNGASTNDNPAVSMTVDREFVENMPLNGRSFQDLIQLAPGTVSSQNGYYSINGQRTDSNNYTVDGVSANLGGWNNLASANNYGSGLSGSSPSQTVLGTTQSLVSIDALQEFTIQTSGYTAEYGRNPGGQVQFTTRSGTNGIHGSLFEYLRNTIFDANSSYNDYYKQPQTAEHQNDFGGTAGGPLIIPKLYDGRDKTFYFFSYEGLRLLLPTDEDEYVPTQAFRNWASPNIQPFLNAVPLPSAGSLPNQDGCSITAPSTGGPTACDALFYLGYSYPNNLDNISLRVDQNLGRRLHTFARYADTRSSVLTGLENPETQTVNTHTWTAGLTAIVTGNLLADLRFNYTRDGEESIESLKPFGGSAPWEPSLLIPAGYYSAYASPEFYINLTGTNLRVVTTLGGEASIQHQYQVVDTISWKRANHSFKFGIDWRRLTPTWIESLYSSTVESQSLTAIQEGYATSLGVNAVAPGKPVVDNLSLYAQDHWKANSKLSVDYGLRWEFNPPPGPSNGLYPVTLTSSDLATATLTNDGTQPYKTNYHSFAPRFGFAWDAIPSASRALTVRGGFGIFFDTGQSSAAGSYAADYPFTASRASQANVPFPLSQSAMAPPPLNFPLMPPYSKVRVSDPALTLPYTEQWNLSIDEKLNQKNTLTVSYVGNNGRKLLFTQYYEKVANNPDFVDLWFTYNGSQSSYNALQIQDRGPIARGLELVGSFTWSHALDNASSDYSEYVPLYGNSNYDLRRVLNLALNYQTPAANWNHWMEAIAHGWILTNRFSAQSGYPDQIIESTTYLPDGSYVQFSPDLVPGVPIYLHGKTADVSGQPVLEKWRLNRAAFACTTNGSTTGSCGTGTPTRQGTLGRNYVRNPSFWALNTSVQRNFPIYEHLQVNFRAEAFNILNHPNNSDPESTLSSSTFGQLVGGVTTIGSSNSLYAMGAARSLQFSFHLQF